MASRRERAGPRTRAGAPPPRARHNGGRSFRRTRPRSGSRPFLPDEEHALFNAAVKWFAVGVFAPFPLVKKINIGHVGCAALCPRRRIGSHGFGGLTEWNTKRRAGGTWTCSSRRSSLRR